MLKPVPACINIITTQQFHESEAHMIHYEVCGSEGDHSTDTDKFPDISLTPCCHPHQACTIVSTTSTLITAVKKCSKRFNEQQILKITDTRWCATVH